MGLHRWREVGAVQVNPILESDEEEPPCECVQVDADEWSARYCPAHGPGSPADKRRLAEEAEDEARAAARIPILLGIDPKTWDEETPF